MGRWPSASEQQTGAAVIVLTDWFWRTPRRTAPVLGSRIKVGGTPFTIIGIAPSTFHGFRPAPSFAGVMPAQSLRAMKVPDWWLIPTSRDWRAVGRLAPGVSMQRVVQRLGAWRLETLPVADGDLPLPPFLVHPRFRVIPARDWIVPLSNKPGSRPSFGVWLPSPP